MFKIILTIAAIYILFKLISNDRKKKKAQEKAAAGQPSQISDEMVKDPICGAYVAKNSDIRVKVGEKVECFCSYDCRDQYLKQLKGKE